jgi:ATP-dependent Clp protease ATP-binding subunit ClpC
MNVLDGNKEQKPISSFAILNLYAVDVTEKARNGELDPLVGRDDVLERVITILKRRLKRNPALVGEAGVGKTAIVEGLALAIVHGNVPRDLLRKRVLSLDIGLMVAGTKYRGEFEERLKNVIKEINEAGDIIVFFDELHMIVGAGSSEGSIDAANILKPVLSRGEIQAIGATTIKEYRKYIEKDRALERRFQYVPVHESTPTETFEILKGLRPRYEQFHGVTYTDEVLKQTIELVVRYRSGGFLPDKAIDVIDEAGAEVSKKAFAQSAREVDLRREIFETKRKLKPYEAQGMWSNPDGYGLRMEKDRLEGVLRQIVETEDANRQSVPVVLEDSCRVISRSCGVPIEKMGEVETARLINMEDELHKRVVSQHQAITKVSKAVRRGKVGLKDPKRPIGSFLFLGATGVGKTEVARGLAEFLFGTENALVRFDMSEFMEKHSVAKLIGSPPGYVGYDEGGQLTEKIRRTPYCVVLLDEIEKAHPDVWNILLQVMEDGRLTDGLGSLVDCKNIILIMTSNLGAKVKTKSLGFVTDLPESECDKAQRIAKEHAEFEKRVMNEVKRTLSPELLNRIDDNVVFQHLQTEDVYQIIDRLNVNVNRVAAERNFTVTLTEACKSFLMTTGGYDQQYGARPMRRKIQKELEDVLTTDLLAGKVSAGDKLTTTVKDGAVVFDKETEPTTDSEMVLP